MTILRKAYVWHKVWVDSPCDALSFGHFHALAPLSLEVVCTRELSLLTIGAFSISWFTFRSGRSCSGWKMLDDPVVHQRWSEQNDTRDSSTILIVTHKIFSRKFQHSIFESGAVASSVIRPASVIIAAGWKRKKKHISSERTRITRRIGFCFAVRCDLLFMF